MTFSGTLNKAGLLFLVFAASMIWSWAEVWPPIQNKEWGQMPLLVLYLVLAGGAFVLTWLTVWKKEWSHVTAPAYTLLQGLVMGGAAAGLDRRYPGAGIQAVSVTAAMCLCLLLAYRSGIIHVTDSYNRRLTTAIGGGALFYAANFSLGFVGIRPLSVLSAGVPGVLFIGVSSVIAALNFVVDFDFAAQCTSAGLPKYMEWYAAFGLIFTLIWFYMDMIVLISKARSRKEGPPNPA
jgi:uncharacterized YccA/Bax inhibitor family protein